MRLPFGFGKARDTAEPQGELSEEAVVAVEGDSTVAAPTGSCAVQIAGKQPTGQFARLMRLSRGPRRWTAWRFAAAAILMYVTIANLAYFLVLKPVRLRLDGLKGQKAVIEDLLVARESSSAVAAFRDELMKGDQRMTVITSLEQLAEDASVRLTTDATLLSEADVSKRMVEYPVELTLKGDYHEIGDFLGRVESSSRFMIVRRVTLDAPESSSGTAEARIVIGAVSWED